MTDRMNPLQIAVVIAMAATALLGVMQSLALVR
jgi:hypothetical protein